MLILFFFRICLMELKNKDALTRNNAKRRNTIYNMEEIFILHEISIYNIFPDFNDISSPQLEIVICSKAKSLA